MGVASGKKSALENWVNYDSLVFLNPVAFDLVTTRRSPTEITKSYRLLRMFPQLSHLLVPLTDVSSITEVGMCALGQ